MELAFYYLKRYRLIYFAFVLQSIHAYRFAIARAVEVVPPEMIKQRFRLLDFRSRVFVPCFSSILLASMVRYKSDIDRPELELLPDYCFNA